MVMKRWVRRRWLNFRHGHSFYLIFALSFANFILIFHRLLIERVEPLAEIFSDLWFFLIFFIIIYIPTAILIGHWHMKTQVKVEAELLTTQNPMMAKWWRILIEMQRGKASEKEVEDLLDALRSIENEKSPSDNSLREDRDKI